MLYLYVLYFNWPDDASSFIVSHSEIPDNQVLYRFTGELDGYYLEDNSIIIDHHYRIVKSRIEIDQKVHL